LDIFSSDAWKRTGICKIALYPKAYKRSFFAKISMGLKMTENRIPRVGWSYLMNDGERMWIAQRGEGSRTTGTMRYAVAVHYFQDPGGRILLPYVMSEIETVPGIREKERDSLEHHYFFFDGNGSGRFIASEHASGQERTGAVAEPRISGYAMERIQDLAEKLPDHAVRTSIGGLTGELSGCHGDEIMRLAEGEPTLAHRYNRDSVFYGPLRERLRDLGPKQPWKSDSAFHMMLGRCLSGQIRHYL
jgi:hypothetical protein